MTTLLTITATIMLLIFGTILLIELARFTFYRLAIDVIAVVASGANLRLDIQKRKVEIDHQSERLELWRDSIRAQSLDGGQ